METDDASRTKKPTPELSRAFLRRTLFVLWRLACIITVIVFIYPVKFNMIRYLTVGGFFCIWAGALILWGRLPVVSVAAIVVAALTAAVLFAPGRPVDPSLLRSEYTKALAAYKGSPYIWGGESIIGIDCSGLIRRGLIDAEIGIGLRSLNPRALRDAFAVYWHDCSASDLGKGYGGRTRLVAEVPSIDSIDLAILRPGDIATTDSGAHILAYLGNSVWIDADPKPGYVQKVHVPAPKNGWFGQQARVMRWRAMES